MTINGPAPTDPRVLPQHRRSTTQVEAFGGRAGPRAERRTRRDGIRAHALADRARHRAGRHPQGGPGPEHLPVLHRVLAADDGRHPGVVHRSSRCATSTRCRSRGYHIAEAGANPISQLAFTLANGFTYVEAYLARGMDIDDFAPNLSFFFSNGMDPEYTVHRPGRPPHLGGRDEGEVRRQRALPEAEVPRADVAAARCTRRRWTSTTSAPRCRR